MAKGIFNIILPNKGGDSSQFVMPIPITSQSVLIPNS